MVKFFGRKKKEEVSVEVVESPFSLNSQASFGDTIRISESVGHIASEKELKRERGGKSSLTLGQKYGGKRKITLVALGCVGASTVLSLLSASQVASRPTTAQVKDLVSEEVLGQETNGFPVGQAEVWLESFVRVWGTWDEKSAVARQAALSPFLAPGLDSQAGWDGVGSQSVIYAAVSSTPELLDSQRAVFDVAYQVQDGTFRCARVPVFAFKPGDASVAPVNQWGFTVTANPTPIPCPLKISAPPHPDNQHPSTDSEAAQTLQNTFFPGFFTAWATSDADTLRQYMKPNTVTFGLGGTYTTATIENVTLPLNPGETKATPGTEYQALVTVKLKTTTGGGITVTYKVPVTSNGPQWQVAGEPSPIIQDPQVSGSVAEGTENQTEEKQNFFTPSEPAGSDSTENF